MKTTLVSVFVIMFFIHSLKSQGGFKEYIVIDEGNTIFSSTIHNDSLFILGTSNDFVNGWHGNFIVMDSIGNWEIKTKLYRGNINNFSTAGKSSRLLNYDNIQNHFYGVMHDAGFNDLFMFKLDQGGNLIWSKLFSYPINNLGIFTYGIIKLKDDYLIYGDIQLLDERGRGFVLKVDSEGNEVYWNLFGQGNNWHEYYGVLPLSDTTFVSYGKVANYTGQNITSLPVWYSIYNSTSGKEIKRYYDSLALDNYNLIKDPFSNGYIGFSDTVNKDTTNRFPHAVWYDNEFRVKRKTPFGIKDPKDWHYLYSEKPYYSTIDAEGNLYAATTGYIPHFDPSIPLEEVSEVLTVTKISPQGDIVWETIDTVFFDEINGYGYVDFVSGINVSSTGSVYVVGFINAIIPPDTTYRGNGWIVKYDKHGCIIENCKLVPTSDIDIDHSNFLLYPNPADDVLNISYSDPDSYIHIYDITGSLMQSQSLNSGITCIDVNMLPKGFYVVSLYDGRKIISSKKIIKQ